MATVIAVANNKGGTGKTSTAVNLAAGLARRLPARDRVLLVDLDPQGNLADHFGIKAKVYTGDPGDPRPGISRLLLGEIDFTDAVIHLDTEDHPRPNLGLIPAGRYLEDATETLVAQEVVGQVMGKLGRRGPTYAPLEDILADRLRPAGSYFKWIVIDCPPKLDILKPSVYRYADWVIVPTRADYLSVSGSVAHTRDLAQMIEADPKVKARIFRILPTMVSRRQVADRQMRQALAKAYGRGRIGTPIPSSVKVKEAPGRGLTVEEYAPGSAPALAYGKLVEDVITHG